MVRSRLRKTLRKPVCQLEHPAGFGAPDCGVRGDPAGETECCPPASFCRGDGTHHQRTWRVEPAYRRTNIELDLDGKPVAVAIIDGAAFDHDVEGNTVLENSIRNDP